MKQQKINEAKREIDNSYNKKENCLKIEGGNSLDHEFIKFMISYILRNNNISYLSEARFIKGGRCDVLDLENKVIYEVIKSEKLENFKEKIKKYPNWEIKLIYCSDYEGLSPYDILERLKKSMIL